MHGGTDKVFLKEILEGMRRRIDSIKVLVDHEDARAEADAVVEDIRAWIGDGTTCGTEQDAYDLMFLAGYWLSRYAKLAKIR